MPRTTRRLAAVSALLLGLLAMPAISLAQQGGQPEKVTVIVTLQSNADSEASAKANARRFGGQVGFVYRNALKGFTLTLPEPAVAALERAPGVVSVERDFVVTTTQVGSQPVPTGVDRMEADRNPPASPMNVDIAIIDTGIWWGTNPDGSPRSHQDLNLRYFTDCTGAIFYPLFGGCQGGGNDGNGHGTHVAGIAAAYDNSIGSIGMAPGAVLWSFKALNDDGTGYGGSIIAAIDLATAHASEIEVINMSFGFQGTSEAIDTAITGAVNAGIVVVAAAGNDAMDAAGFSPANHPDVITVSALADFDGKPGGLGAPTCRADQDDTLADFSNFGPSVELIAPGVCIYSTHLNDGYAVYSGTSMAAPAVTGVVARYIAQTGYNPSNRTQVLNLRAAIMAGGIPAASTCGWTGDADAFPEPLVFVNSSIFGGDGTCDGSGTPPPPNVPPTASFTHSCTDLACTFTDTSADSDGSVTGWSWNFGDGATSNQQNPSHTFATGGSKTVTLTVTDNMGAASAIESQTFTVTAPSNLPPTASFTSSCTDLSCSFTDTSTDPDGSVAGWSWSFGDGATSTVQNPNHTYGAGGTYTVTLTVTDDLGATSSVSSQTVSVTEPPTQATTVSAAALPILVDGRDATIDVWVLDTNGEDVIGATVYGTWSYVDRRGKLRTTSASSVSADMGIAPFSLRLPRGATVQEFCVTNVVYGSLTYVPTVPCGWPLE